MTSGSVYVGQSYPCSKQCLSLSTARAAEANSRRTGSSNMSPINFLKQKPMGVPRNTWVVSHLWETKNEAGHELQGFFSSSRNFPSDSATKMCCSWHVVKSVAPQHAFIHMRQLQRSSSHSTSKLFILVDHKSTDDIQGGCNICYHRLLKLRDIVHVVQLENRHNNKRNA